MRKASSALLLALMTCLTGPQIAAETPESFRANDNNETQQAPFTPFTGKIVRDKVRLRIQPALDSPILREFNRGDMLIVMGETEDFYAVQPPMGTKAYIFRTFVLDNTIEGNHVNVRLEPNVDSPVIAQLNSGEHVQGAISQQNNKWLEIVPPPSTRFYVSKDYVEKIGDQHLLGTLDRRRQEANQLLGAAIAVSQKEMQKPFDEINLEGVYQNLNRLTNEYSDFPELAGKGRGLLTSLQEKYLHRKVEFLEEKAKSTDNWQSKNSSLQAELQAQKQRYDQLQQKAIAPAPIIVSDKGKIPQITESMNLWIPFENVLYDHWKTTQPDLTLDEFYALQQQNAVTLRGVIEPYNRTVKNKPGDFVLISKVTNLPIAYIYSTKINLLEKVGQEVVVEGYSRPNNNFAFPAYFVLSVE